MPASAQIFAPSSKVAMQNKTPQALHPTQTQRNPARLR